MRGDVEVVNRKSSEMGLGLNSIASSIHDPCVSLSAADPWFESNKGQFTSFGYIDQQLHLQLQGPRIRTLSLVLTILLVALTFSGRPHSSLSRVLLAACLVEG